jgi:hypothetical protein
VTLRKVIGWNSFGIDMRGNLARNDRTGLGPARPLRKQV